MALELPAWATQKLGPLPVWGYGALAVGGGLAYTLYRRRSSSSAAPTLNAATAGPNRALGDFGGGAGGGAAGGGSSTPGLGAGIGGGTITVDPGSGSSSGGGGAGAGAGESITYRAQPAEVTGTPMPAVAIAPSLLGGGYEASRGVISNPAGIADRLAALPQNIYTPSLTDYASEQPGGIQTVQAGLPGTQPNQGLTYTILGTTTGTGPPVPANQRIAGERYDSLGRVIL